MTRSEDELNICFITESFYPELDGGAVHSRQLAERLQASSVNIEIVTRHNQKSYPRREVLAGIPVQRVGLTDRYGILGRYLCMLSVSVCLMRNRRNYDVVMVAAPRILGAPAVLMAKVLGKKCVLKPDSCGEMDGSYALSGVASRSPVYWLAKAYFSMRNTLLKRADGYIAISDDVFREICDIGVTSRKIVKIPNGVDVERFVPVEQVEKLQIRASLGLSDTAIIFVFCGRLTREKGLHSLLRVWKKLTTEFGGLYLLLVGSGEGMSLSCEEEIRQYVKENGIDENVTFTGAVDDVRDYLHSADLFILPSLTEALGIALIEAQACGLPAIGSRVGGIPEVIDDGVSGLLVEPDQDDALLEAAERMIKNENMRVRFGAAARKRMLSQFSMSHVAEKYIGALGSMNQSG